jgi:hypothetical protein
MTLKGWLPTGLESTTNLRALVLGGLAAAGLLGGPAQAQTFGTDVEIHEERFFDGYCVMGAFQVCASVRLFSDGNTLRMQVWNLEGIMGDAHSMTAIGLYHSGTPWSGKVMSYSVTHDGNDISSFWSLKRGAQDINNLANVKLELKAGTQGNSGIIGCTNPGGNQTKWSTCGSFPGQPYVEFTFNLNSHFALGDGTQLRWHSQQIYADNGGNRDLSLKCDTGGAGEYPGCIPMEVVPEPVTSLLLGSGLLGLGAASRHRRRRQRNEIQAEVDA